MQAAKRRVAETMHTGAFCDLCWHLIAINRHQVHELVIADFYSTTQIKSSALRLTL